MEKALYDCESGYYTSSHEVIGKYGDYYTSPDLSPLFGEMMSKQIEEMWKYMEEDEFTIVEYGAGTGSLCNSILSQLRKNKKLYRQLRYCIIERSARMREKERNILDEKVSWHDSISDLNGVRGCVLSNELLDNFSVHQVVMLDDLMEVFVDFKNGFVEVLKPARDELRLYLDELGVVLPYGFRTEINLEMLDWIIDVATALEKGFLITIDYGYPSNELYSSLRRAGTLLCYKQHQVNDNPYRDIGRQDITAHVNFSALQHWGLKRGLKCCGFTDQAHFLLSLGFSNHLRKKELKNKFQGATSTENAVSVYTLLMDLGKKIKVMIQQKGMQVQSLSGLRFAGLP
jgi:SAM-dependent MidA family methyltransferase